MDRRAVLADNAKIFAVHGAVIGQHAHPDCKVLVVGNPCNTNACVAMHAARPFGRLAERNFVAMLRLDHYRALAQLAQSTRRPAAGPRHVAVRGNHSPIVFADDRFATADGDGVQALINDTARDHDTFVATVDGHGAAILAARNLFAAALAASAAIDQMRDYLRMFSHMPTQATIGSYP